MDRLTNQWTVELFGPRRRNDATYRYTNASNQRHATLRAEPTTRADNTSRRNETAPTKQNDTDERNGIYETERRNGAMARTKRRTAKRNGTDEPTTNTPNTLLQEREPCRDPPGERRMAD